MPPLGEGKLPPPDEPLPLLTLPAASLWARGSTHWLHDDLALMASPSGDISTTSESLMDSMIKERSGVSIRTLLKLAMTASKIQP